MHFHGRTSHRQCRTNTAEAGDTTVRFAPAKPSAIPEKNTMRKVPRSEKLYIDGPAGRLEALLEEPAAQEVYGGALICHPHPQEGGTLQNKVVHTLARAFQQRGMRSLRFNFRGVGTSEGTFDEARGEFDDALAALRYLRSNWPHEPCWIAGFSFGAAIAIRVAAEEELAGLVCVAPAVYRFAGKLQTEPRCPWLIAHGDQDEVVALDETIKWLNELQPGPELQVFADTGHFFHGKLVPLREAVERFLAEHGDAGPILPANR
jgi:hypothetical protein